METVFTHSIYPNHEIWPRVSVFNDGEFGFYAQIEGGAADFAFCFKAENRGTILGALCELLAVEYDGDLDRIDENIIWLRIITSAIHSYQKA